MKRREIFSVREEREIPKSKCKLQSAKCKSEEKSKEVRKSGKVEEVKRRDY
jgi:hypothetical protein